MSKHESNDPEMAGYALGASDTAGERVVFGVTLEQIDTLNRLIVMIAAHGDVVSSSQDVELAKHTIPLLGHAIFDAAKAARDILRQVEAQQLGRAPRANVGETRAVYGVGRVVAIAPGASRCMLLSPEELLDDGGQSASLCRH